MKEKIISRSAQLVVIILLATCAVIAQQDGTAAGGTQQVPGAARISRGGSGTLSFEQAIQLAIENNLSTLLARERRNEARGEKQQSRSTLLPQVSGAGYQANTTENLVALGFQPGLFPGLSTTLVGPFRNFDARVRLSQTVFDLSAIQNYRAGRAGVRVAELREALAREQGSQRHRSHLHRSFARRAFGGGGASQCRVGAGTAKTRAGPT